MYIYISTYIDLRKYIELYVQKDAGKGYRETNLHNLSIYVQTIVFGRLIMCNCILNC